MPRTNVDVPIVEHPFDDDSIMDRTTQCECCGAELSNRDFALCKACLDAKCDLMDEECKKNRPH